MCCHLLGVAFLCGDPSRRPTSIYRTTQHSHPPVLLDRRYVLVLVSACRCRPVFEGTADGADSFASLWAERVNLLSFFFPIFKLSCSFVTFLSPCHHRVTMSSTTSTNSISIVSLASHISQLSAQISSYFSVSPQPEPNFSASSTSVPETPEYEALRAPLNDAALDLLRLINGPKSTLRSFFFTHYDLAAFQVAIERRFFNHVPLPVDVTGEKVENGQKIVHGASAAEIAEKAGMDEDRTARALRLLATQRIFEEVDGEEGRFRHTANSALLARDEEWNATAAMQ